MIQIHKGRKFLGLYSLLVTTPPMIATTQLRAVTMVFGKLSEEGLSLRHLACPRMEPLITLAKQQLRVAKNNPGKESEVWKSISEG